MTDHIKDNRCYKYSDFEEKELEFCVGAEARGGIFRRKYPHQLCLKII